MRHIPALFLVLLAVPPAARAAVPAAALDRADLMRFLDDAGRAQPVRTPADWQRRRRLILDGMQQVMGPVPDESHKVPPDLKVLETVTLDGGVTRKRIDFAVEKGDRLPAYLLIPANLKSRAPAVLCLHQTTKIGKGSPAGVGVRPTLFYALELANRGYVTLAPDYPSFGDYRTDPNALGYASATMKGVWNHMRCVDLLQSLDEVDPERIGCVGHSLGGHNTMFVAAFDVRIKAAASSCGFTSFPKYYNGNLTGWSGPAYMPRIAKVYDKDPRRMPFDFPEVVAALAPRPILAAAPTRDHNFDVGGVKDCITAARPVYGLLGAKENLAALHPDAPHEFTDEMRTATYEFFDRHLKRAAGKGRE